MAKLLWYMKPQGKPKWENGKLVLEIKVNKFWWIFQKVKYFFHIHSYKIIPDAQVQIGVWSGKPILKTVKKCTCGKEKEAYILKI